MANPTLTVSQAETTVDVDTNTEVRQTAVERIPEIMSSLQGWAVEIKEFLSVLKTVQKDYAKLLKSVNKRKTRSSSASEGEDGNTRRRVTPSGFTKPVKLSDSLCDFMGVAHGTTLPRTNVTKYINEYIKTNNLQDPSDKRHILPDDKLKTILDLSGREDSHITYFNMQTFIKHHFSKVDE